jgi:hypothetical protein
MKTTTPPQGRVTLRIVPTFAVLGAIALATGCSSGPDSHVVSAPPPASPTVVQTPTVVTTTTQQTTPATQTTYVAPANSPANTIYVTQAPPAMQQEVVLARPSSSHVWVPGYWTWRNDRYEWMAGHWEIPPRANATWVAPRWEREGNAYRFYEGYWD